MGKRRKLFALPPVPEGMDLTSARASEDLKGPHVPQPYSYSLSTRTVFCERSGELFGNPNATISATEIAVICDGVKQLLTTHFGTDRDELFANWRGWRDRPRHLWPSNPLMLAEYEVQDEGTTATLGMSVHTNSRTFSNKTVYVHCFSPARENGPATAWMTRKYVEVDTDPDFYTENTRTLSITSDNPVRAGQAAAAFNFARLSLGQRAGAYTNIPRLGEGEYYLGIDILGLSLVQE